MKLLKKISISTVNALPKGGFKGIEEKVFAMRVLGQVRASEVINTPYGESIKFKGEFRAWGQDGVECVSAVAYLPSPLDAMLEQALTTSEGRQVEFAVDVFVRPDEGSSVGYVYEVVTLTEAAPSDPVARLASSVPTLPAVPAPTKPEQAQLPELAPEGEAKGKADKAGA